MFCCFPHPEWNSPLDCGLLSGARRPCQTLLCSLLVEVDGSIVPAEPDLAAPGEVPDGDQDLSLRLALGADTDVVLVARHLGLDEVNTGHVRLSVRVDDDDVV